MSSPITTRTSPRRNKTTSTTPTNNDVMTSKTKSTTKSSTKSSAASAPATAKCSYKACTINEHKDVPANCIGPGCSKTIHLSCFNTIHSKLSWLGSKDKELIGADRVACSKTCWTKYTAFQARKPSWSNDGKNGPDDPLTSEKILLEWMMEEGNYAKKWRGKDSKGKKKKHVAAEIAQKMNAAKVRVSRDAKQVMNKISHIEKSFRSAHDFANSETGQGLKESNWGEFDDAVRSKCPFYFDLLDIFGDRASAKPKATSNESLESSDDDELKKKSMTWTHFLWK